ncbi:MAG TPA: hypothetical protein VGL19_12430 [Polyangiaceae bacterium]|jgi:hypothetical protein
MALALAGVSLPLFLLGCPANTCLLTVNGQCKFSTCPDGSEYRTARHACVCRRDRVALGGGCLTVQAANQYCGKGAHYENGGCAANRCPAGLELDQDTGACLTPQQTTQVASNMGVEVGKNQKLGCPSGEQLVVEGQQAACVPLQHTCGRDETWDGSACRKTIQCPTGSTYDAPSNSCVNFATGAESSEYTVDLATWVRTSFGPDGGQGVSTFCGLFNKHPLAFGVRAGATLHAKINVTVQTPDRQISGSSATTFAVADPSGQAVPAKGAAEVQQAATSTLGSLIAGGGKANAAFAGTNVSCTIVNSSAPTAVTVTGGA